MDANSRMSKNSKNGNAVNMAFDGNQMAYLTNFQMPPPPPPPQHYPAYFYPEPQDQSMVPVAAGPIVQPDQYMDWTGHDDQFQLARAAVAAIPMPQTPRKIRPIQSRPSATPKPTPLGLNRRVDLPGAGERALSPRKKSVPASSYRVAKSVSPRKNVTAARTRAAAVERSLPSPPGSAVLPSSSTFDAAPFASFGNVFSAIPMESSGSNTSHDSFSSSSFYPQALEPTPLASFEASPAEPWVEDPFIIPPSRPHTDFEKALLELVHSSRAANFASPAVGSPAVAKAKEDDGTIAETGVTNDDIEAYIMGPEASDGKWVCTYQACLKRFGRKENIRSHVQTHLGDRQFRCRDCEKCFVRQHDLKRHAKIHTGAKPYPCACGQSFARQDALTRHRQRGNCSGAFQGLARKEPAKRGRPRKQRVVDVAGVGAVEEEPGHVGVTPLATTTTPPVTHTAAPEPEPGPADFRLFPSPVEATLEYGGPRQSESDVETGGFPAQDLLDSPPITPEENQLSHAEPELFEAQSPSKGSAFEEGANQRHEDQGGINVDINIPDDDLDALLAQFEQSSGTNFISFPCDPFESPALTVANSSQGSNVSESVSAVASEGGGGGTISPVTLEGAALDEVALHQFHTSPDTATRSSQESNTTESVDAVAFNGEGEETISPAALEEAAAVIDAAIHQYTNLDYPTFEDFMAETFLPEGTSPWRDFVIPNPDEIDINTLFGLGSSSEPPST